MQEHPQYVGSRSDIRPSSGGPVMATSWAQIAAGGSHGSLSQPWADQLPAHPVVNRGPRYGPSQHRMPPINLPIPNSGQCVSQRLYPALPAASQARNLESMDTLRSNASSIKLNVSSRVLRGASLNLQTSTPRQSSKSELPSLAYCSSDQRSPRLSTERSPTVAASPLAIACIANSFRQLKSSNEESPQREHIEVISLLVKRPQYCDAWTTLQLYANFFRLRIVKQVKLVRYGIEVTHKAPQSVLPIFRSKLSAFALRWEKRNSCTTA